MYDDLDTARGVVNGLILGALAWLAIIVSAILAFGAGEMEHVAIVVRSDVYAAHRPAIQRILCELWGRNPADTNDIAWCDSGWQELRARANTNITWMAYWVTDVQTQRRATATTMTNWLSRIPAGNAVRIMRVRGPVELSLTNEFVRARGIHETTTP